MNTDDLLKPMGIGELLDKSLVLYKKDFAKYFAMAFIGYLVPIILIGIFFGTFAFMDPSFLAGFEEGATPNIPPAFIGLIILFVLLFFVAYAVLKAGLIKATSDGIFGREVSVGLSLKTGVRKLFPYMITAILFGLAVLLGYIFLIIPGIAIAIWYSLMGPVVVIEDTGYASALGRSYDLVKGNFWRTLGFLMTANLLGFAIVGVVSQAGSFIPVIGSILSLFAQMILIPFQAITVTLYYYNQRSVKEGYDLSVRAEQRCHLEGETVSG